MRFKRGLWEILALVLGMLAAGAAAGADRTRAYLDAHDSPCAFGAAHAAELRKYKVLLVPGYFGSLHPDYYAEQLRWLASLGVDREKVAIRSGQSVGINAAIISSAIRDSSRPVILITHSKGSVDALEALRAGPSLRAKVRGWVSLQGAFFGSPVADILLDGSVLDPLVAAAILGFLGGSREAAQGLTTGASRAYYRNHAAAIGAVVREVPAIAFATSLDETPGARTRTLLEIPRELMRRKGIPGDGLLPTDSALLPGMDFVRVPGVDHIAPVMPALAPFDRVRMTRALLLIALRAPFRGLPRDPGCAGGR